jgi:hypothetical protein
LSFPAGWGAPEKVTLPSLSSWSSNEAAGIRYFSGTATYVKEFVLGPEWKTRSEDLTKSSPGSRIRTFLDLGRVEVMAAISVNGRDYGALWKPPFRVDATEALQPGTNRVEVKVTNLWPNRLIGDEQIMDFDAMRKATPREGPTKEWLRKTGRFTYTTYPHLKKTDPLLDSGLLGPVVLESTVEVVVRTP